MYSRQSSGILTPYFWKELNSDGNVFEPWQTSILLEAQDRALDAVALEAPLRRTARASVANAILQQARNFQRFNRRLDVQAIAEAAVRELLARDQGNRVHNR